MINTPSTATVYLGLGSNLQNPADQIKRAINMIDDSPQTFNFDHAPFYQSKAWGNTDQPDFINTAVKFKTSLTPNQVIQFCQEIETMMGRKRYEKWGPRIIDIDLLLYDDLVLDTPDLKIPHPYLHERAFVLKPLLDLNPKLTHPLLNKTLESFAKKIKSDDCEIIK